jgi:hypothetical protein
MIRKSWPFSWPATIRKKWPDIGEDGGAGTHGTHGESETHAQAHRITQTK